MIRKSKNKIVPDLSRKGQTLPALMTQSLALIPGETKSWQIWKEADRLAVEECRKNKKQLVLAFEDKSEDTGSDMIRQIGVIAEILSVKEALGDSQVVVIQAIERVLLQAVGSSTPYLKIKTVYIENKTLTPAYISRLTGEIIDYVSRLAARRLESSDNLEKTAALNSGNPVEFVDRIVADPIFPFSLKKEIIQTVSVRLRLEKLSQYLKCELDEIESVPNPPKAMPCRNSKSAVGRLGSENQIITQLKKEVKQNKTLPIEAYNRCLMEIDRLANLSTASSEYGATRQYIDWLLAIPWNIYFDKNFDLKLAEKEIDKEYYGSKNIKARILERIAINRLRGNKNDGPILTLAGVPGTGKASLARAIAKALGRKFIRLSVGGVDDISDIKGSARTYLTAGPGLIVRAIKDSGVIDPVIFLEDIDNFAEEAGTALAMSLMEALDPRYNNHFSDDYIGLPLDLSRIFFICAVRSSENMPDIYSHRLEVIELPGYIEKEKIFIAQKYLVPTLLKKHGLLKKELSFTENGLKKIIRNYTMEAGLLKLKRRLERICRFAAKEKALHSRKNIKVSQTKVETLLGTPKYLLEMPDKSPEIGVAVGLAWTGTGGDLMIIEGLRMKGSGEVITTGSLGDVMKESIQAAHSYIRSKADVLGIDHCDFDNLDIHIHFPSGAIPKDGPSAGVAVALVVASVMAERPIRNDIAMTGEMTLRGKVLQVGGLVEKISAAYRAGLRTIFLPRENKKDLKDLPPDILKQTKFIFIETVDEIFAGGLLDFIPSSYTLEKLFVQELEKAKDRKKRRPGKKIAAKSSRKK